MLLCQREPYTQRAVCDVLSCEPVEGGFEIALQDSVLYPEGGGQPCDTGQIGEGIVSDVQKSKDQPTQVVCRVDRAVPLGMTDVSVDWARRYDHMQQHSAQHLLTALALDRFGYRTVGFHLGAVYSAVELDTPELSSKEQQQLLEWANSAIREARAIRFRVVTSEEYAQMDVRSRGLPETHQGDIRLVEIDGIDLNTCGGTHVASTAELQMISCVGIERIRRRVRFQYLAGNRLFQRFQEQQAREQFLTQKFSRGPEDHLMMVEKIQQELTDLQRSHKDLMQTLASSVGQSLAMETTQPIGVHHQPGADLGMLDSIVRACHAITPEKPLFLTASSAETGEGVFLLAGSAFWTTQAGSIAAKLLAGRGGGKPGRFQGKATAIEKRAEVAAQVAMIPTSSHA